MLDDENMSIIAHSIKLFCKIIFKCLKALSHRLLCVAILIEFYHRIRDALRLKLILAKREDSTSLSQFREPFHKTSAVTMTQYAISPEPQRHTHQR